MSSKVFLDEKVKDDLIEKPNALKIGKIDWNKTSEIIWRVYNSEVVNSFLNNLIESGNCEWKFD